MERSWSGQTAWRRTKLALAGSLVVATSLCWAGGTASAVTTVHLPQADARVASRDPGANFGTARELRARGGSNIVRSYLTFSVGGVGAPITSATLRLVVTSASVNGGNVHAVGDTSWGERTITYRNAPSVGAAVASMPSPATTGSTVEVDVKAVVTGPGTYSFAIVSANSDDVGLSSREGGHPPQLIVETSGGSDPTPPPGTAARFEDVTAPMGLDDLATAYAHAAAWGDVNGDGRLDLFVGTFADKSRPDGRAASPSRLFLGTSTGLVDAGQPSVEVAGRAAGAVFADLDNDGDLDLFVSHNRVVKDGASTEKLEPHHLFRNDAGRFTDVSAESGVRASDRNGRSVGVADYDGDGLVDLFVVADSLAGGGNRVSRLLRNAGGLRFSDATVSAGLPTDRAGLGVAVGDANGDGWPDLLMTGGVSGSGRYANTFLFMNRRNGTFAEVVLPQLAWTARTSEDWTAGATWGDLNRDGRADLVVSHHFGSAAGNPIAPRLYMNRGNDAAGNPRLEEVVGALAPIAAKAPHVEIRDFDNDGWPDIYVSVRLSSAAGPAPYVYRHSGLSAAGLPRFQAPTGSISYYSPGGPTADFDGDGRVDVFLEGFSVDIPPSLLRNTTASANRWLDVTVSSPRNTSGLAAKVFVYRAGRLGDASALLGAVEISTGNGFSSAAPPVAHFGVGSETTVDIDVQPPFGAASIRRSSVPTNARIFIAT